MIEADRLTTSESPRSTLETVVRIVTLTLLLAFSSLSLNWYSPYIRPYSLSLVGLAGSLLLGVALCRSSSWQSFSQKVATRIAQATPRDRRWVFTWGLLAPGAVSFFVLDPIPHIPDGYAYLFQAKLFSIGKLATPTPAFAEFFPAPWSVDLDGRVFSVFPPGWPILLTLGVALGQPAIVNPVLGALSLWVMWHLWKELFDEERANAALLLCAVSPFFLFMSASFMSHNASLFASSTFVLAFLRGVRLSSPRWGALAGAAIGFQILIRPPSALFLFAAVVGYFAVARRSRASWIVTACSIAGAAVGTGIYGIYNRFLVGEWGTPPLYFLAPENRFGFGADIGLPWASSFPTPGHDLLRALLNLNFNMSVMNNDLLGWPLASLAFALLCLLLARLDWRHHLSATIIVATAVGYLGYWYNGVAFGARFYYCLLPYLVILTVEGVRATPHLLASFSSRVPDAPARAFVGAVVAGFVLYGALVYVPRVALTGPYWNQRKISFELYEELASIVQPGDLVLVETDSDERYNPVFVKNEPVIAESPILYAWDQGDAKNAQLIAHYANRRVVRWRYPIERLQDETPLARLRARLGGQGPGPDGGAR